MATRGDVGCSDRAGSTDADFNTAADAEPNTAADAEPNTAVDAEPNTAADAEPNTAADAEPNTAADDEPNTAADAEPNTKADAELNTLRVERVLERTIAVRCETLVAFAFLHVSALKKIFVYFFCEGSVDTTRNCGSQVRVLLGSPMFSKTCGFWSTFS